MAFYDIHHPQGPTTSSPLRLSSSSSDDSMSMTPRRGNASNMTAPPSMHNKDDLAWPVGCNNDNDLDIYERTAALILAHLKDDNVKVANEVPVPVTMCPNSTIHPASFDTNISSFQTTKRAIAEELLAARVWQHNALVSYMLNLFYAHSSIWYLKNGTSTVPQEKMWPSSTILDNKLMTKRFVRMICSTSTPENRRLRQRLPCIYIESTSLSTNAEVWKCAMMAFSSEDILPAIHTIYKHMIWCYLSIFSLFYWEKKLYQFIYYSTTRIWGKHTKDIVTYFKYIVERTSSSYTSTN